MCPTTCSYFSDLLFSSLPLARSTPTSRLPCCSSNMPGTLCPCYILCRKPPPHSLSRSFLGCHHIRQTVSDHLYRDHLPRYLLLYFAFSPSLIFRHDHWDTSDHEVCLIFLNTSCGCSSSAVEVGCTHVSCSLPRRVRGRAMCGFQEEASAGVHCSVSSLPPTSAVLHMGLLQAAWVPE